MKLLLADDHTLFRDTLVQYIKRAEPDSDIVLAKDLHEALELMAQDSNRDLILLDLKMPGMEGLQGLKKVREEYPDVPVALMSGVAEPHHVAEAIDLGAIGYFPKTMSGKALIEAIQKVLSGQSFVPRESNDSQSFMPSYYADEEPEQDDDYKGLGAGAQDVIEDDLDIEALEDINLTPREAEVLGYLSKGESNKEIAGALGLQVVTVKLHVRGICHKLGVKNRTQAALRARELKLVS